METWPLSFSRRIQFLLWNEFQNIGGTYMTVILGIALLVLGVTLIMKGTN